MTTPDPSWTLHDSGKRPTELSRDTLVCLRFNNGIEELKASWAGNWDWRQKGSYGIAAYRILAPGEQR